MNLNLNPIWEDRKKSPRYFRRDSRGNPRDLNMCRTGRSAALSRGRKSMPPRSTVVKRTRVPAGYLVKMATDADVDSGRKRTRIQSVEAYIWNVLSGKIHGDIRNIQCKSWLRGTCHRCTIAPRKNIFWRGCFVFMFFSVSRVPVFFHEGTWHIYEGTWVVQGCLICFSFTLPRVSPNFGGANEATNVWTRIL